MAFGPAVTVGGAIVEGVCDAPAEPTYSVITIVPTSSVDVPIPDGARYFDVNLYNDTTTIIYGSGAPILWGGGGGGGYYAVPQLVRDYTTGVFMPPYPGALAGFPTDGSPLPEVTLDTNVECRAIVIFYLEM
jgi:hypothetical protein